MGKVEAFMIPGVECWFWSADHHPPHFHARHRGEWEVKVWFLEGEPDRMFQAVRGILPGNIRKALYRAVEQNRDELLIEWEAKVHHEDR